MQDIPTVDTIFEFTNDDWSDVAFFEVRFCFYVK